MSEGDKTRFMDYVHNNSYLKNHQGEYAEAYSLYNPWVHRIDLSYKHEADIFANQMKFVKPLSPYEIFIANLEAGSDDQLLIKDLVESYHLTISNKRAPGNIVAVSTLESIFQKYGYHILDRTLRLCVGTWEGDANSFSANMLNALAKLCVTYGDTLKEEVFKEKLGAVPIRTLSRNARERRAGSMGFAEAMVIEYNGRTKTGLHRLLINKLYSHEQSLYCETDREDDDQDGSSETLTLFETE